MEKFARQIIRYRKAVITITLLLTVVFGYFIKDLKVNSDILSYLPKDDKSAILYNRIGQQYGGNNIAMIAVETDNIFNKETLGQIRNITDSILTITEISSVTSLTNVFYIKTIDGGTEIGKLIDEYNMPETPAQFDSLKQYVLSKPMFKGSLISEDATSTLIVAKIIDGSDIKQVVSTIKSKITHIKLANTTKLYYGGKPILICEVSKIVTKDMAILGPIAFLIIALIIYISFRSKRSLVLPLITVLIAIVWTLGIISMLDYQLTMITSIIPVILLAVGSGWPIHIVNRLNVETDTDQKRALVKALMYVALPVSVAAIAAMIGFLTFVFGSYLTMIQQFGIFSAMGIFIALLLSLTFTPALIASWGYKIKPKESDAEPAKKSVLDNFLMKITSLILHRPVYIIIPWIIVFIISIIGITKIQYKTDIADYFKENSDIKKSERLLQDKFSGSGVMYVTVKGNVQSPEVLNAIKHIQEFMEKNQYIKHTQSVADVIVEMNEAMGGGKKLPDEQAQVEQLWFLLEGLDVMKQVVNDSLTEGLIIANMSTTDIDTLTQFTDGLKQYVKQFSPYQIEISGMPSILLKLDESIVQSQRRSLFLAIFLAFVLVAIVFKSVKKGLYSIVPMISSVLVLYGFMGWAGIPIDIATVLVGSIGVGVGDYVIHIISGFNYYDKLNHGNSLSLTSSIRISGKAVIINVMSVCSGFIVLVFSNLVPLQGFGTIIPVTLLSSALAAITLLPIIIKATHKSKTENTII